MNEVLEDMAIGITCDLRALLNRLELQLETSAKFADFYPKYLIDNNLELKVRCDLKMLELKLNSLNFIKAIEISNVAYLALFHPNKEIRETALEVYAKIMIIVKEKLRLQLAYKQEYFDKTKQLWDY
jgi:hypothetical protein